MTDQSPSSNPSQPVASPNKSIGDVLNLLQPEFPDISISKIRFLESRGLVEPHRAPSGYRKFGSADIDRLRWILTMQRDHFLPLRVIKERLDRGETSLETDSESSAAEAASVAVPKPVSGSRFQEPGPHKEQLDPEDLARLAGLSAQQLDQLVKFGLLEVEDTGDGPRFSRDELRVARAAASFLEHGIEARHLKAWRVAAEREAGMLEQIVTPLGRKGSPEAANRAREVADDLVDMGNVIREAVIVRALRDRLGLGAS